MLGSGTQQDPFQVATAADLAKVGTGVDGWNLDSYYIQTADIDLDGYGDWTPIGGTFTPFVGSYDGNGFVIRNFTDAPEEGGYKAIFRTVGSGGVLTDIRLEDVNLQNCNNQCAPLATYNAGTIRRCSATGVVVGVDGDNIGGLVAINAGGQLIECYSECDVSNTTWNTGGLIGMCYRPGASVTNCYATGNVIGARHVGGLVGLSDTADITNCYSRGHVTCVSGLDGGGLVGSHNIGTISSSYYDSETSGQSDTGKGIPKTTAEMKSLATFVNWDIASRGAFDPDDPSVWYIAEGVDYPRLGWEHANDLYLWGFAGLFYPIGWYAQVDLPSPSVRLHTDSVPDRDGEYLFGADYESRIMTLTLTSQHLNMLTKPLARRSLYAAFNPKLGEQRFRYEGLSYSVRPTGMIEVKDYPHHLVATVPLKMADPFGYSGEQTLVGSGTATNSGIVETYPTFIVPPSTNPSIQVGTKVLNYSGTIAAGQTLVIDCKHQTAYIGSVNVIGAISGDFPVLEVGDNAVTVPAGTITKWHDLY